MNVNTDDLDAGDELSIKYDGAQGPRTITAYVVQVFDPYPRHGDDSVLAEKTRVRLAEPDNRRPRLVQFTADPNSSTDPRLYSLNTKGSKRRLGTLLDVQDESTVPGASRHSDAHEALGEFLDTDERAVVTLHGDDRFVVTDRSGLRRATVVGIDANNEGEEHHLRAYPSGVGFARDGTACLDAFRQTGETYSNTDASMMYYAAVDYDTEALVIDGTRYEVALRYDHEEHGVRLQSEIVDEDDRRRTFDARLTVDAFGLTLTTTLFTATGESAESRRIDAEDVQVVTDAESDEDGDNADRPDHSDQDEDDAHDAERPADDAESDTAEDEFDGSTDAEVREAVAAIPTERRVMTDGGHAGSFDPIPTVESVAHHAYPLPAFEDYNAATDAVRQLVREQVERLVDTARPEAVRRGPRDDAGEDCPECDKDTLDESSECGECGTVLMTDGGRPRPECATGENPQLSHMRHEALQAHLDGLDDAARRAASRSDESTVTLLRRRKEDVRHELSRRRARRVLRDKDAQDSGEWSEVDEGRSA